MPETPISLPPLEQIEAEIQAREDELRALQRLRRVARAAAKAEETRRRRRAIQRKEAPA